MGKSNNRKDMHDYADDYDDYGDYRAMDTDMAAGAATDTPAGMTPDTTPAGTATKAKMSSQRAKQRTKRNNQIDR
jgi:hypothetical protein